MSSTPSTPPAVIAKGISIIGEEGPVYGPLDVTIPGIGLTILSGRGGSGRTALALTISGRMKSKTGELEVLGHTNLNQIRRHVAIAGVEEIDQLDRDVTIRTVFTEHRAWSKLWITWVKKADEEYYTNLCAPVFGERTIPPLDAYVSQISGLDRILLRIVLALNPANGSEIGMLVMDDLDQVREFDDRLTLVGILGRLSESIPVVVNASNTIPSSLTDAFPNFHNIELFTDAAHLRPENLGSHADLINQIAQEFMQ